MSRNSEKEKNSSKVLQLVAPGSPLREGIDNVLRAKTGGLIVLGYNEKVKEIVDGGFSIDCSFSPSNLYELAKMDGAIILSELGDRILFANTQLEPHTTIPSTETGMRHRTAERVAKQTGNLVIAVSQRRNVITLYQGNYRYVLKDIGVILTKANQAIQTLEKYKKVLDQGITNLGALEIEELVTYQDVIQVLHRFEMVLRIKNEIINYVNELGTEGRLIRLQLTELMANVEEEARLLIKDYIQFEKSIEKLLERLEDSTHTVLLEQNEILKFLGHVGDEKILEAFVTPKGYRLLNKIPRLPNLIKDNLISTFKNFNAIMKATMNQLEEVDGIGEIRAKKIKEGLHRIQEQLFIDRLI